MSRVARIALAVLFAGVLVSSAVQAGSATHHAVWKSPERQAALLSVLAVNSDGTLRITAWGEAKVLLGRDFAQAVGDLNRLNAKISAGQVRGFHNTAELSAFELTEPPAPVALASTLCERTCYRGTCCCRGWWIFCWGWCNC